jgi:glycosyltransferase involved in cell wall biosynthesis
LGLDITLLAADLTAFSDPLRIENPSFELELLPAKLRLGLKPIWITGLRDRLLSLGNEKNQVVLHDHGLWLPRNGISAVVSDQLNAPLVISTRGMLEPWAFNHGRLRKRIAWSIYQKNWLEKADLLHATSYAEAVHLHALGIMKPIVVIPNGTVLPDLSEKAGKDLKKSKKQLLFLSRIHPKKGLLQLIKAFHEVDPEKWELIIAGYDEGGYQKIIEKEVNNRSLAGKVIFFGPVDNQGKWKLYQNADLFVLPSYSENFGIVVVEALASGLPVITTKGTPWQNLEEYDCGWWVEAEVEELKQALAEAFSLNPETRIEMGRRGRELAKNNYSWEAIGTKMKGAYEWLLGNNAGLSRDIVFPGRS